MPLLERLRLFCAAMSFVCPGLFISFAGETWTEFRSLSWTKTEATIVQTFVTPNSDDKGRRYYDARIAYEYRVADQIHRSERLEFGNSTKHESEVNAMQSIARYAPGERVTAYYDPAAPAQAVLNPGVPGQHAIVLIGLVIVGAASWGVSLHWLREWLNNRAAEAAPKPYSASDAGHFREDAWTPLPADFEIPEYALELCSVRDASLFIGGALLITLPCLALMWYSTKLDDFSAAKSLCLVFPMIGLAFAAFGFILGGFGLWGAFTQGERLTFDRHCVRVRYPLGRIREFRWSDGIHVELVDREVQYEERTGWVPIPLVGTISMYETKSYMQKRIQVRDHEGKRLYMIDANPDQGRKAAYWLFSRQLAAEIFSLGGRTHWGIESLDSFDFRGVSLGDRRFMENIEQWAHLPELKELNLDRAGLTDAVVPVLERLAAEKPKLKISAQGTNFVQPPPDENFRLRL